MSEQQSKSQERRIAAQRAAHVASAPSTNVMRHEYRILNEEEKALMKRIKDLGKEFYDLVYSIQRRPSPDADVNAVRRPVSRELNIAATKIEEAVMWAVKHVTG